MFKSERLFINPADDLRYIGRYINHSKKHPNCVPILKFWPNECPEVMFKCTRSIGDDEQICFDYGRFYKKIDNCVENCFDCATRSGQANSFVSPSTEMRIKERDMSGAYVRLQRVDIRTCDPINNHTGVSQFCQNSNKEGDMDESHIVPGTGTSSRSRPHSNAEGDIDGSLIVSRTGTHSRSGQNCNGHMDTDDSHVVSRTGKSYQSHQNSNANMDIYESHIISGSSERFKRLSRRSSKCNAKKQFHLNKR